MIHAPDFRCAACGSRLSAYRREATPADIPRALHWPDEIGLGGERPLVWILNACSRCREKVLQKEAARRRRDTPREPAGVDIDRAFATYRKLPPFAGNLGAIKLEIGHRAEARWSGHAKTYRRKIRVAFGPSATKAEVLEVLVHEMCHLACPRRTGHGERFRRVLQRAARELWGIDVPIDPERGDEHNIAYAMDRLIMKALEEKIAAGAVETFPPQAKPPKKSRAELMATRVEKREGHARKMLVLAERAEKRAKTRAAKWRAKVRYYDRVAAKKGSAP